MDPKKLAERETQWQAEWQSFTETPEGQEFLRKLNANIERLADLLEMNVEDLSDPDAWWEKAAEVLSFEDYKNFIDRDGDFGGIEDIVFLREKINARRNGKSEISVEAGESVEEPNLSDIDKACITWVGRSLFEEYKDQVEFLKYWNDNGGKYYSQFQFKAALKDACKRGLIKKGKNRLYYLP